MTSRLDRNLETILRLARPLAFALAALGLGLGLAGPAAAEEQILAYHSDITVDGEGNLLVVETIRVRAEGVNIQRGIYRDFPLDYSGPFGTRVRVPFRVVEVLRDGQPEPHHTESIQNGVRVYIGSASRRLDPGEYEYTLSYETGRQLGFFDDHDELYWNVTGNDWAFPILEASATVTLPPGASPADLEHEAYTGFQGDRGRNYTSRVDEEGRVHFETTEALARRQGLTIVVSFPKGIVREPTTAERRSDFFAANRMLIPAAITVVAVLAYYLVVWWRVGRDPERGIVIPLFEPPDDMPPACARFVWKMKFDRKCFTAALLDMGAKGYLRIIEGKNFRLARAGGTQANLSSGERAIAARLLTSGSFILRARDATTAKAMKGAIAALRQVLTLQYEGEAFRTNRGWLVVGIGLSVLGLVITVLFGGLDQGVPVAVFAFFASFVSLFVALLTYAALRAWTAVLGARGLQKAGAVLQAVLLTAVAIPVCVVGLFLLVALGLTSGPWLAVLLFSLPALAVVFYVLLRQPSQAGRKLMDRIEGFRMYLSTAERDELRAATPAGFVLEDEPEMTIERYEQLLPYAVALDVENEWSEKLSSALAAAGQAPPSKSPSWYSGPSWSEAGAAGFASALGGSLTGAVASASTPPGSSSGGGGGGSSGGGGGGGGGGGW